MKRDLSQDLAKKMLDFQIQWGQWNKNVINQVFNINGKGDNNLTLQQFIILMLIHKMDITSVSQMACLLNLSKSSLSLTLSKMEKEDLLQKTPAPKGDDGRKVYLCVTQKGISALEEREQKTLQFFVEYCDSLSQQQRNDLSIGIEKLSHVLSKDS
ncbi:MarR family transcriptional regulator [Clostridium sp. MD294]|uniref:MarR family winged helix-turn-helix transcriptional regulator n=1 Tax=Clostridium sp. MD294 TaxID=97138 RepID=UPI0002CB5228|nr:MarR family transcriptional regulator [Clostridium sp. MD294]USF29258.1 hypothetical protein C820_000643 [Clostridium sp. MD294]